jgi:hypothetical protein
MRLLGEPRVFWWAKLRVTVNRRFKKAAKLASLAAGITSTSFAIPLLPGH